MGRFEKDMEFVMERGLTRQSVFIKSRRGLGIREIQGTFVPAQNVAIIVDCETDHEEFKEMADVLCDFIRNNKYYKNTNYKIFVWDSNGLTLIQGRSGAVERLRKTLEDIDTGSEKTGDWEGLKESFLPYRNLVERTIVITDSDKIEKLRDAGQIRFKNFTAIYKGDMDSNRREMINSIPCVAYYRL